MANLKEQIQCFKPAASNVVRENFPVDDAGLSMSIKLSCLASWHIQADEEILVQC